LGKELDPFLSEVVEQVAKLTETEKCAISLIETNNGKMKPQASYGFEAEAIRQIEIPVSQNEDDVVYRILHGETVKLDRASKGAVAEKCRVLVERMGAQSALITPLQVRGDPIGLLGIYNKADGGAFSAEDIQLLQTIANQVAVSISNARYYENLQRTNEELRQKTLEAQEVARLKSQFLSNISHELRTPLNAILGYTHLLMDRTYGALGPDQEVPIEGILRNGEDLLRLVNDVLNLSRIEAGKLSVNLSTVELPALYEDVLEKMRPLIDEKVLSVRWAAPRNLPSIQSDAQKIRQILTNLLSNAIKFTPKGSVTIETTDLPQRDGIEIKVHDTGVGIKREELPRIFEAFHQVDGTSTREFGGVGLGLTIVRELAEALKGEVHAESEYGKGSAFTVFLPYRYTGALAKSA
jgi:signal transduction histidine kinase